MEKRQQYTIEAVSIPADGTAQESDCADIAFYNYGTEPLIINDVIVLQQNQFIAISGNTGEVDRTKYRVRFGTGGGTTNATIVRRLYK